LTKTNGIELGASTIVVLHALPDEARHFGAGIGVIRSGSDGAFIPTDSISPSAPRREAQSLCIGVGMSSAQLNTASLLRSGHRARALLIVGFAGGLQGKLKPGDLVAASTVSNSRSARTYSPDPALLSAALEVRLPAAAVHCGGLSTADRVLGRAVEKREFARTTEAIAVDMESAGAAAAATEYGVPWLTVRVITDGVDDDLPLDFNALANPDGSVNRRRIVASTLLHPWKIPALVRLGSRSSLAARNLSAFLHALLPRIPA
jgi:adenosylhomocysteine nucleosidase